MPIEEKIVTISIAVSVWPSGGYMIISDMTDDCSGGTPRVYKVQANCPIPPSSDIEGKVEAYK